MTPQAPAALEPQYKTDSANDCIVLYSGDLEISDSSGTKALGSGRVSIEFLPDVRFVFSMPNAPHANFVNSQCQVQLLGIGVTADGLFTEKRSGTTSSLGGILERVDIGNPPDLHRVVFGLVNFHRYYGDWIQAWAPHTNAYCGRLELVGNGWNLTIDAVPNLTDMDAGLIEQLRARGGFAVTHAAELKRCDGSGFSVQDAEEVLHGLHYFFSFLKGQWCPSLLPVGFDAAGGKVWESWHAPVSSTWGGASSWFPGQDIEPAHLSTIFDRFLALWAQPDWKEPLYTAIHLYVEANELDTPETASILSQVALELLSWTVHVDPCVDPAIQQTPAAFEVHKACPRIELLLNRASINLAIPAQCGNLTAFAASLGRNLNGPKATTEMRNKIVHPTSHNRGRLATMNADARVEASQLALEYFELALLHMLNYPSGAVYRNRIDHRVGPVSW